jgi:hypothetical protein
MPQTVAVESVVPDALAAAVTDTLSTATPLPRIDTIANVSDGLERNTQITSAYMAYGAALTGLLGSHYASFPHFLAIGSRSVGEGMRGFLFRLTGGDAQLADGNRTLFLMTAPTYDRFIKTFAGLAQTPVHQRDKLRFEAKWKDFEREVRTAAPTPDIDAFVNGFRQYFEAMFEPDLELRQQRIYFGNVLFAYVEQRAAQPILERSVPSFFVPLSRRFWARPCSRT